MVFVFTPFASFPSLSNSNSLDRTILRGRSKFQRPSVVCCSSRPTDDDNLGSLKRELDALFVGSPSGPISPPPTASKSLDEVKEAGMNSVREAADDLKSELEQVGLRIEKFADEESAKVLEKYEEANRALIEAQRERIEEIKRDARSIQELTDSIRRPQDQAATPKRSLLNAVAFLFTLGAFSYGITGITNSNTENLQYATVDALFAAILAYLASVQTK